MQSSTELPSTKVAPFPQQVGVSQVTGVPLGGRGSRKGGTRPQLPQYNEEGQGKYTVLGSPFSLSNPIRQPQTDTARHCIRADLGVWSVVKAKIQEVYCLKIQGIHVFY